jgi:hypothetical protein
MTPIIVFVQGKGQGLLHSGQRFRFEQDSTEHELFEAVGSTISTESRKGYMNFEVVVIRPEDSK